MTAIDRFFFGEDVHQRHRANPSYSQKKIDIRDLRPDDFEGLDAVCDLAALSNDPSADIDLQLTDAINFSGRLHVATCAKKAGVARYILSSSCSIYGVGNDEILDESASARPLTAYAKASYRAEQSTAELASDSFTWVAIRNATVFGLSRRMQFDLVVNLMTLNAIQKGKIFILGGGRQWRPLVHVRDVAGAINHILLAPREKVQGQLFNVGFANSSGFEPRLHRSRDAPVSNRGRDRARRCGQTQLQGFVRKALGTPRVSACHHDCRWHSRNLRGYEGGPSLSDARNLHG